MTERRLTEKGGMYLLSPHLTPATNNGPKSHSLMKGCDCGGEKEGMNEVIVSLFSSFAVSCSRHVFFCLRVRPSFYYKRSRMFPPDDDDDDEACDASAFAFVCEGLFITMLGREGSSLHPRSFTSALHLLHLSSRRLLALLHQFKKKPHLEKRKRQKYKKEGGRSRDQSVLCVSCSENISIHVETRVAQDIREARNKKPSQSPPKRRRWRYKEY